MYVFICVFNVCTTIVYSNCREIYPSSGGQVIRLTQQDPKPSFARVSKTSWDLKKKPWITDFQLLMSSHLFKFKFSFNQIQLIFLDILIQPRPQSSARRQLRFSKLNAHWSCNHWENLFLPCHWAFVQSIHWSADLSDLLAYWLNSLEILLVNIPGSKDR